MPWETIDLDKLAKKLGVNANEVREKHNLINKIIKVRKECGLTQAALAKKLGISQARVAKIESGIGTRTITFDALLKILNTLGYDYRVVTRKLAA